MTVGWWDRVVNSCQKVSPTRLIARRHLTPHPDVCLVRLPACPWQEALRSHLSPAHSSAGAWSRDYKEVCTMLRCFESVAYLVSFLLLQHPTLHSVSGFLPSHPTFTSKREKENYPHSGEKKIHIKRETYRLGLGLHYLSLLTKKVNWKKNNWKRRRFFSLERISRDKSLYSFWYKNFKKTIWF